MKNIAMDIPVIIVYWLGFLVGYITNRYELRNLRKKTDELTWFSGTKGGESEDAREIFEEIKRSKVTLGHPAKIICFRATPTGEVEETVEGWVVPQSRIEELEKKYIGGKTDEDISD